MSQNALNEVRNSSSISELICKSGYALELFEKKTILPGNNIVQSAYGKGGETSIVVEKSGRYKISAYSVWWKSDTHVLLINNKQVAIFSWGSSSSTQYGNGYALSYEGWVNAGDVITTSTKNDTPDIVLTLEASCDIQDLDSIPFVSGTYLHKLVGKFYSKGTDPDRLLYTFKKSGSVNIVTIFVADAGGGLAQNLRIEKPDGTKNQLTTQTYLGNFNVNVENGDKLMWTAEGNSNVNNGYGLALCWLGFAEKQRIEFE